MPEELDYPEITLVDEDGEEYQDPLTFICQIRCEELAAFDPEGLLPHEGMLWFFAALDYFLGDIDSPAYPGMGDWQQKYFRVLYWPTVSSDDLHTHSIVYDDGSPVGLPAEAIAFSAIPCVPPPPYGGLPLGKGGELPRTMPSPCARTEGESPSETRLLGEPYLEEVREQKPGMISLLQIDEDDRWNLVFHDCGMLNFLITPDDLKSRRWDKVQCHLFSF